MENNKYEHLLGEAAMESRRSLRTEIETLIEPHRHSDQEPPFSAAELVIMAIICNDESVTPYRSEIFPWVMHTFRYYSSLAIPAYVKYMTSTMDRRYFHNEELKNVVKGFEKVFEEYEVPLIQIKGDYPWLTEWGSKPSQARLFLLSHLEPPRTFPFFNLPRELRDRVYEELLVYPWPGFAVQDPPLVSSRISDDKPHPSDWWLTQRSPCFTVNNLSQSLQLLQTCRKIYEEAMPIHHGLNTFSFDCQSRLADALNCLTLDRARHLKTLHLSIETPSKYSKRIEDVPLARQISLKQLLISVDDPYLLLQQGIKLPAYYGEYPGMEMILDLMRRAEDVRLCLLNSSSRRKYFLRFLKSKGIKFITKID